MVTEVNLMNFPAPLISIRVGVTLTATGADARPTGYIRHYSNIAKLEHLFWLCVVSTSLLTRGYNSTAYGLLVTD